MLTKKVRAARLLVVLLVEASLLVASTGVVAAGTQGSDCPGDTSKVQLFENGIGDTGDGDDRLWLCGNTSNLNAIAHTLSGDCKGALFGSTTWNDCVSSYRIWTPPGWHLTVYREGNYGTWFACYVDWAGGRTDVPSGSNDVLSSFKWISGTTCP